MESSITRSSRELSRSRLHVLRSPELNKPLFFPSQIFCYNTRKWADMTLSLFWRKEAPSKSFLRAYYLPDTRLSTFPSSPLQSYDLGIANVIFFFYTHEKAGLTNIKMCPRPQGKQWSQDQIQSPWPDPLQKNTALDANNLFSSCSFRGKVLSSSLRLRENLQS